MNRTIRHFLFEWYLVIALGLLLVAVVMQFVPRVEKTWEISLALVGAAVGLVHFVQKQKLEELRLFDRLFTRFNQRYAALHDQLQAIHRNCDDSALTPAEYDVLDRYFNLCAEEFLFYTEDRILPSVWKSWCLGMVFYLECRTIRRFWREQEGTGSHYGLTTEAIYTGAGRAVPQDTEGE